MSWGNLFKSGAGRKVVSKVDRARQEGYDAGYAAGVKNEEAIQELSRDEGEQPCVITGGLGRDQLRGYIMGLENAVRAIESMPSRSGRNQILAVIEEQLMDKKQERKEDQAQEVTDGG